MWSKERQLHSNESSSSPQFISKNLHCLESKSTFVVQHQIYAECASVRYGAHQMHHCAHLYDMERSQIYPPIDLVRIRLKMSCR